MIATRAVEGRRFDPSVEAAVYLCAVTALEPAVHERTAEAADAELQRMLDRVQAVGGGLTERTRASGAHELLLTVPVPAGRIIGASEWDPPSGAGTGSLGRPMPLEPRHEGAGRVDDRALGASNPTVQASVDPVG